MGKVPVYLSLAALALTGALSTACSLETTSASPPDTGAASRDGGSDADAGGGLADAKGPTDGGADLDGGTAPDADASQAACTSDQSCPYGFGCDQARCVPKNECESAPDCPAGSACVEGDHWKVCEETAPECRTHSDCGWGNRCRTDLPQPVCEPAGECSRDNDCRGWEVCLVVENWKECKWNTSPAGCQGDADCPPGYYCEIVAAGYGTCRYKDENECMVDQDCDPFEACAANDDVFECVETPVCAQDEDCGFGFRCVQANPRSYCEYANQCVLDVDCEAWKVCAPQDNRTACKIGMPDVCASDQPCAEDEYCDAVIGSIGSCRSRNQCFIDEDCGIGLKCESNGVYNECIPTTEHSCYIDLQCHDDWICMDRICRPQYEGMCTDVEGQWTPVISDCLFFIIGQGYEFVPKDGCNGDIKSVRLNIPIGTFKETAQSAYELDIAFIATCTASVDLGMVMSVDCGNCTAEFGRF